MTKVNLLPDYIWEGKRRRATWLAVTAVLILELVGLFFVYMMTQNNLKDITQQRDDAKTQADAVDAITAQADKIVSSIKPITDRTTFVEDVLKYNQKFPDLFDRTNLYTFYQVRYRQLQPAQTVLNMSATAKSVADVGRYLLNIQRAKDTFTTVSITSQMPGWPTDNTAGGGATTPTGYGNPYTPSGLAAPATTGLASYNATAANAFTGGDLTPVALPTVSQIRPLDFTAVGQLVAKFQFMPPQFPGGAGSADQSGGASYGSAYPGASSYTAQPPGGASGYGGGGANGGGANGGGANGGGT